MSQQQESLKIELATENPTGSDFFYAPLRLPASQWDIRDAIQRARGSGRTEGYHDITITQCMLLPQLADIRLDAPTIRELNFFAKRLTQLPEEKVLALNAILQNQNDNSLFEGGLLSLKDLINLTYGLDGVVMASNIKNDEQLGELVIESGMNADVDRIPEDALYLVDKAALGRFQRKIDGGVYWGGYYFITELYELPDVYDGVHLPEETPLLDGVFQIQVAGQPNGDSQEPSEGAIWISLPIDRDEADKYAQSLGADSIEHCELLSFESAVPQINADGFGQMHNFDILNKLAACYLLMEEMKQIKYKAVLEAHVFRWQRSHPLIDALDAAEHIDEYELSYFSETAGDFSKEYLFHNLPTNFDIKWLDNIQASSMGINLLDRLGASCTKYGVISARGKSLYELVPYDQPQNKYVEEKGQNSGGMQL